jgi:hypothetical protein
VVSRLRPATNAHFRLAFTVAPAVAALTVPRTVTRRIILQKARGQALPEGTSPPTAWKHTISGSLSLPSPGCFSPFPHGTVRYRSLRVACLGLWSARLPPRFFVPGRTQEEGGSRCNTPTGLSPALVRLSRPLRLCWEDYLSCASSSGPFLQPHGRKGWRLDTAVVWAITRFVRHYYGCRSLFLRLLRCFSWPGALRAMLGIPRGG